MRWRQRYIRKCLWRRRACVVFITRNPFLYQQKELNHEGHKGAQRFASSLWLIFFVFLRDLCGKGEQTKMKQVVAALIVRDNKILICQRTEDQALPLKWEFPGGKVERDEDLKDALHRELEEELGIDAVIGSKIAAIQDTYGSGASLELYFYRVDEFKNEIKNRIFRDVRWVDRKELTTYDFLEADVRLVKDISAGKLL